MLSWSPRATAATACLSLLLVTACAAPPNREIADAQAALSAAEAAGAEEYAPDGYRAASDAYRLANEAVMNGDYRLALNRALESRELSQTAIRQAEERLAQVRADAHRALSEVTALLGTVTGELQAAERGRMPRRTVRDARAALTSAEADVQEAGKAINEGKYDAAGAMLQGLKERLTAIGETLAGARPAQTSKRRGAR